MKETMTFDHVRACFPRETHVDNMSMTDVTMPISFGSNGGWGQLTEYMPTYRTLSISGFNLNLYKLHPKFKELCHDIQITPVSTAPAYNAFKMLLTISEVQSQILVEIAKEVFDSEFIEDFESL